MAKSTALEPIQLQGLSLDEIRRVLKENDSFDAPDPFAGANWETVAEDDMPIELTNPGDVFVGIYAGAKIHQQPDDDGAMQEILRLRFVDAGGDIRGLWANYRLIEVFGEDGTKVSVGTLTRLEHFGKKEIGGGRTLNLMSIKLAK